jgi:hypothetical protein
MEMNIHEPISSYTNVISVFSKAFIYVSYAVNFKECLIISRVIIHSFIYITVVPSEA